MDLTHQAVLRHERTEKPSRGLSCIDLFAGAGGLAEGFRQSGFAILSGNDIDEPAGLTFRRNFPEATFFQCSVAALTGKELLADAGLKRGQLDCLIGGPPCQSFSYNNHDRSRRKARARLFRDYIRLVDALQPATLVMENVPGILTVGGGAIVDEIYSALAEFGYECEARILFAEEYGVPQLRRRVFFIATRLGWEDSLFPRGTHGPAKKPSIETNKFIHRWTQEPGEKLHPFTSVWSAIGDLPRIENGGGEVRVSYTKKPFSEYQIEMRAGQDILLNHVTPALKEKLLKRIGYVPEGGNWRDIPFKLLPPGMQRAEKTDHTKRYGRLSKKGLCCTILTKCDPHWGSYIHPSVDRVLSVREAARLQSFPDRFEFVGYQSNHFQQIGNAVPPLLGKAIGSAVAAHISKSKQLALLRAA